MIDLEEEIIRYIEMNLYYSSFVTYYYDKLNTLIKNFDVEMVLYDETEYF